MCKVGRCNWIEHVNDVGNGLLLWRNVSVGLCGHPIGGGCSAPEKKIHTSDSVQDNPSVYINITKV